MYDCWGVSVPSIAARTCEENEGLCPIRNESGDWVPADDFTEQTLTCETQGSEKLPLLLEVDQNSHLR